MKLKFIFLGKKGSLSFNSIINKYIKRLGQYAKSEYVFFNDKDSRKIEKKILGTITPQEYLIVLDESGKLLSTLKFTQFLEQKTMSCNSIIFVVGGAYGVPKNIINKSNYLLSFSKMTLPHMIARLILVEQTYRAFTILHHHPYHHE